MPAEDEVVILTRLAGVRRFLAETAEEAAALRGLGVETEYVGTAMATTTRRGYLMNQALFTVRRLIYGVTLATIASGVEAVKWGFQFNAAMQSARVALGPVFGDAQSLNAELDYLFNFTKYTPFQFKDITIAFRQMYGAFQPLGISVDTTNQTIAAMVDALSFVGRTSPGALNRVAVALQHMAFQGRLTGQTTLQLARDGLPIYAALRSELGLTADQMHHVGQLGIPTLTVLRALIDYIQKTPGYAGAAHRQATRSLTGLFTTFKDNLSQIMGEMEMGFFNRIQHNLTRMNAWFDRTSAEIKASGGTATAVIAAIDPALLPLWHQIAIDLHLFWVNFSNIVHALITSRPLWALLYAGLVLLHVILVMITPLTHQLGMFLNVLIPLWVAYKVVTWAAAIATGAQTFAEIALFGASKDLTFAQFLLALWTGRYALTARLAVVWTKLATLATWLYVAATTALSAAFDVEAIAAAAAWAITLAPITLIAIAIGVIIGLLVILYFKWTYFHNLVNRTWNWIVDHKSVVASAIAAAFSPLIAVYELLKHIYDIWNALRSVWHWFAGGGGHSPVQHQLNRPALRGPFSRQPSRLPGSSFAGLQGGGTVAMGGLTWVGESGPELLSLPAGATVTPHSKYEPIFNLAEAWMKGGGGKSGRPLKIQVMINRRILGEAVADEMALQGARA